MKKIFFTLTAIITIGILSTSSQEQFEKDVFKTSKGDLEITFVGHGTLYLTFMDKIIHIDPVGRNANYEKLPKADIILVTHHHGDHLDSKVIDLISKSGTELFLTKKCFAKIEKGDIMNNGDINNVGDIKVVAVPAYNIKHKRDSGDPFHPKGEGNGYIITLGDKNLYVGGDTENIPEMSDFKDIDIAFLPMNLPYTMSPEMVANAVKLFKPKIVYPYHYGSTDTNKLVELLKDDPCEVRIRKM